MPVDDIERWVKAELGRLDAEIKATERVVSAQIAARDTAIMTAQAALASNQAAEGRIRDELRIQAAGLVPRPEHDILARAIDVNSQRLSRIEGMQAVMGAVLGTLATGAIGGILWLIQRGR